MSDPNESSDPEVEQKYVCPECGAEATVVSEVHDQTGRFDELHAILGCSKGHDTVDMQEERNAD